MQGWTSGCSRKSASSSTCFQHSENLDDQNRALLLFTELGDDEQIKYAKHHRGIIERFGRFPHRNAILGRASRPDEIAAEAGKPW